MTQQYAKKIIAACGDGKLEVEREKQIEEVNQAWGEV